MPAKVAADPLLPSTIPQPSLNLPPSARNSRIVPKCSSSFPGFAFKPQPQPRLRHVGWRSQGKRLEPGHQKIEIVVPLGRAADEADDFAGSSIA